MHLAAVYDSVGDAEAARERLLTEGIAPLNIALSRSQTEDPIAAEWPGQSYENQPGQPDDGSVRERAARDEARYNEAVRAGVCVLSVEMVRDDRLQALVDCVAQMKPRSVWVVEGGASRRVL